MVRLSILIAAYVILYQKGATGLDGRYEVQAACRGSATTLKGRKNTIANTNLALAA